MPTFPKLLPFHPSHYLMIAPRPEEAHLFGIDRLKQARDLHTSGPGYTAVDAEGPWAAGGIAVLRPGVGEAWVIASERVTQYARWFLATTTFQLEYEAARLGLRRVQAEVHEDFAKAIRYLDMMGFTYESRLTWAAPDGRDLLMYRRLFDV